MESGDRLLRSFRFADDLEIGVALDDGNNTLSNNRVVIDAQDCDAVILRQDDSLRSRASPQHIIGLAGFPEVHQVKSKRFAPACLEGLL